MDCYLHQRVGTGFRITAPQGNIEVIVRRIYGTKKNRIGEVEVHGSPLISNGLVELTQEEFVLLAPDIQVKVANGSPGTYSRLRLYITYPLNSNLNFI